MHGETVKFIKICVFKHNCEIMFGCINMRDNLKEMYRLKKVFPALNCEHHRVESHNKPRCSNK